MNEGRWLDGKAALPGDVPARALYLSLGALLVPFAASGIIPGLTGEGLGLLVWIAAFIPAFLLSYFRGWRGSAVSLAAGMAALAVVNNASSFFEVSEPRVGVATLLVVGYLAFSLGLGVVTELLLRARQEAEAEALTDPLTGLANRRHMEIHLDAVTPASRASDTPLSLVMFDLDHFKWLNDTHGHAAGDEVLGIFADILRERARPGWLFTRAGGEEFVAILPDADWAEAWILADGIRTDFQDLELRWKPVTVSAGISTLTEDMEGWQQLLTEADAAVRRAKELGRDRVEVASGHRQDESPEGSEGDAGEEPWSSARAVVVLPPGSARRSVKRALELNGLNVEEWDSVDAVPLEVGSPEAISLVVFAAESARDALDTEEVLSRVLGSRVPKILFAHESVTTSLRSAPVPGVLPVTGDPTGESLLRALPRALHYAVVRSDGPREPRGGPGGVGSRLGVDGAELTEGAIVVVEDERATRAALKRTLEEIGFRDLTLLSTGEEALERVRESTPDLLILDLHLPQMDGLAVLEALQREVIPDLRLPVLVVTGDHSWEVRQRALRMGARDFLNKPFDVAELGARVLNLLETRQLHVRMSDTNRILESRVRQRTWELSRAKDEILVRLARAAEFRDDITGRHAERVGKASRVLAEGIGWHADECAILRRAAPLHDIGKIGIPDSILMKPGPLDLPEIEVMRRHTTIGADLLKDSTSDVIKLACTIALTHHERWDGEGYPQGLAGSQIPRAGQIVALADALDALTHERPYKRPEPFDTAHQKLRSEAGTAFDPRLVEAMDRGLDRLRDLMSNDD